MLKKMKIKGKLILAFIVVMLLASLSGTVAVVITNDMNQQWSSAMKNYGFAQGDVGKLLSCFGSINVSVHDYISYTNIEDAKDAQEEFTAQCAKMDDYFDTLYATIQKQETKDIFATARDTWDSYYSLAQDLMEEGGTDDVAVVQRVQRKLVTELDPLYDTIYDNLAEIMYDKVDSGNALETQLTRSMNISVMIVLAMIAAALVLSLVWERGSPTASPIPSTPAPSVCATWLRAI